MNSSMAQFILRYAGNAALPEERRAQVRDLLMQSASVILDESPRMFLVDLPSGPAGLREKLPDWSLTETRTLPLPEAPDPRLVR